MPRTQASILELLNNSTLVGPKFQEQGRYQLDEHLSSNFHWHRSDGSTDLSVYHVTSWKARDRATSTDVILKALVAFDPSDNPITYTLGTREAAVQAMAPAHPNILALLDAFDHRASSGRHAFLVTEQHGPSLATAVAKYSALVVLDEYNKYLDRFNPHFADMTLLKNIARQTLQGLDHLHACGIAHMGVSRENLALDKDFVWHDKAILSSIFSNTFNRKEGWLMKLIRSTRAVSNGELEQYIVNKRPQDRHTQDTLQTAGVKLTNFSKAVPYRLLQQAAKTQDQQMLQALAPYQLLPKDLLIPFTDRKRPPEEVLGLEYVGPAYDVWHFGCLMYELATGRELLSNLDYEQALGAISMKAVSNYSDDDCYLLEMSGVLGNLPREFIRRTPSFTKYYSHQDDSLKILRHIVAPYADGSRAVPRLLSRYCLYMTEQEVTQFSDFLRDALTVDPLRRSTASELLQHKWLQDIS
eukprot:gene7712-7911_t